MSTSSSVPGAVAQQGGIVGLPNEVLRPLEVLLRIGVGACFIGHGAFGMITKEAWLPYFGLVGIGPDAAYALMPLIGAMDITIGVLALLRPFPALLVYAFGWCLWTAALRPLTGDSIWELLERAGNYGVPLALLVLAGGGVHGRGWVTALRTAAANRRSLDASCRVLQWSTAILLIGHGALACSGKPLLESHLDAVGLGASALPWLGAAEILLAVALLWRPRPITFVGAALWKLATETLFLVAGSPIWEVVERGGSYVAPLGAAWILFSGPGWRRSWRPGR